MKNNPSSYFEDPEFQEILAKYEGMVEHHTPVYFDADELVDIAEYYASNGRHEESEEAIDFALKLHPGDTEAMVFRAHSLAFRGDLKGAYRVMRLINDQSDREVQFLQADLLMDENRAEEADEVLDRLARTEEEELDTLMDIVQAYIDYNRKDMAHKWLMRIKFNHDTDRLLEEDQEYRNLVCDYYLNFNEAEKAIPILQKSLDTDPYSIDCWNDLAKCHLAADNNVEEAHDALDFALAIDDKNPEALALKALCYRQTGDLYKSCDYLTRLIPVTKNRAACRLQLIKTLLDLKDFEEVAAQADTLIHFDSPTDYEKAEAYCYSALSLAYMDLFDDRGRLINNALELNGNDPEILMRAGQYYLIKKKRDEAIAYFHKAMQAVPQEESSDWLMNIANTSFDTQDFEIALKYYEELCARYPERSRETYYFQAYCHYRLKCLNRFLHFVAKIKQEMPDVYGRMGTEAAQDPRFNYLMQEVKEQENTGMLNLEEYL